MRKSTTRYLSSRLPVVINTVLAISTFGLWFLCAIERMVWRADFTAFYTGWAIVRDGLGPRLYDLQLQSLYQQKILDGRSFADGLLPFNYPPQTAVIFSPLASLSLDWAYALWSVFQVGLLLWLLRRLWRVTSAWSNRERYLMLVSSIGFTPMYHALTKGTFSLIVAVCILEMYLALKSDHQIRAGFWLVLGCIKPQITLLSAIILVTGRYWRGLISAIAVTCFFIILSSLILGWHIWLSFLFLLLEVAQIHNKYGIIATKMYNIKGLVAVVSGDNIMLSNWLGLFILGIAIVFTAHLWSRPTKSNGDKFDLRFAFTLVISLLSSLHLYPQDTVIAIIPAVLLFQVMHKYNHQLRWLSVLILSSPTLFLFSSFIMPANFQVVIPILLLLILAAWIGWTLRCCDKAT